MSVSIIVRKSSNSMRFKPHHNHALGKYIGTKEEYVKELKSRGLEPFKPGQAHQPVTKPYTPSKWARSMVETIKQSKKADGSFTPGQVFKDELAKRGVSLDKPKMSPHLPAHYRGDGQGGFHGD